MRFLDCGAATLASRKNCCFVLLRCFSYSMLLGLISGPLGTDGGNLFGADPVYRIATFSADVTPPLGHRCMGILPTLVNSVADPLEVRGVILSGSGRPIVIVAFDWCEIRNDSYDRIRSALAEALESEPARILVSSLHQHDAPVVDSGAQQLLDEAGLPKALHHPEFFDICVDRTVAAARDSLTDARPVSHVGTAAVPVHEIASNRRVVRDGRVSFARGSSSGRDPFYANSPLGLIDPNLRAVTFWDGDDCVAALYTYSTHPMSYYGRGEVSADFVGLARRMLHKEFPGTHHVYVSGCSGDTTAGKFNDGSTAMRSILAKRLFEGMRSAFASVRKSPAVAPVFRNTTLDLPFRTTKAFEVTRLSRTLADSKESDRQRILAAMALASLKRVRSGRTIDLPCVDLAAVRIVLFPAEAFVGYQFIAQKISPDVEVFPIGYGECWPGYIPTSAAFDDSFDDTWLWVDPGCEERITEALHRILPAPETDP